MELENFHPQSRLVTRATLPEKPRFPVIDSHNRLGEDFGGGWGQRPLPALLDMPDEAGIVRYVDPDGGWGGNLLAAHLEHFKRPASERFLVFGGVDWSQWPGKGSAFPEWAADRLRIQKERGAEGLKIWKGLGLHVRDQEGALVDVDDSRIDSIWQAAGELGLPVVIHVADPVAFFDPVDETNELFQQHKNYLPQFEIHKV